jgi:hypothetical protein
MKFWNKKGESEEQGYTAVHLVMVILIFLAMGWILVLIVEQYTNAFMAYEPAIARNVYAYRAINVCLAYQDPFTHRFYPGVIDVRKYNENVLDDCYVNSSKTASFTIQIIDLSQDKEYDRILVGFGATRTITAFPILIRNNDGSMAKGEFLFGSNDETQETKSENPK